MPKISIKYFFMQSGASCRYGSIRLQEASGSILWLLWTAGGQSPWQWRNCTQMGSLGSAPAAITASLVLQNFLFGENLRFHFFVKTVCEMKTMWKKFFSSHQMENRHAQRITVVCRGMGLCARHSSARRWDALKRWVSAQRSACPGGPYAPAPRREGFLTPGTCEPCQGGLVKVEYSSQQPDEASLLGNANVGISVASPSHFRFPFQH